MASFNRVLIEDTREQVRKNRQQIRTSRAEILKNRDQIGDTRLVGEELSSKLQILAEGHAALDEKIDRRFDEAEAERRRDRDHLEALIQGTYVDLRRRGDGLEKRIERSEAAAG